MARPLVEFSELTEEARTRLLGDYRRLLRQLRGYAKKKDLKPSEFAGLAVHIERLTEKIAALVILDTDPEKTREKIRDLERQVEILQRDLRRERELRM